MKTKRIKVVASMPANGQSGIEDLVGRELDATPIIATDERGRVRKTGQVSVDAGQGRIVLQPAEFQFI